ncbi:MAG: YecA family protein [Gammaproteobacteria bacterium]
MTTLHIQKINTFLSTMAADDVMTIDQIHGFLCAVASSPVEVPQTQWLCAITEKKDAELPVYDLTTWYNEISEILDQGKLIEPYFSDLTSYQEASNDQLASWATGYMAGILLNQKEWLESGHRQVLDVLTPISSFAAILAPKNPNKPADIRKKHLAVLPSAIQNTYDFWRQHQGCAHHDQGHTQGEHSGTFRYEQPKTGRNDPCTCASGKKFKKCCGK